MFRTRGTAGRAVACAPLGALAVGLALSWAGSGLAQAIEENLWVTNGQVNAVVRHAGTIYLGGTFTRVGPATGGGVPIDAGTGALPPSFPKVEGTVRAVAADGAGGWYVGGSFSTVGGLPRANIAQVASDLTVTAWDPGASNDVFDLVVSGATVYVAGNFTVAGGQARNFIAALDATTGLATAWNPNSDGAVQALAVSGGTVYAGGVFTFIGGQPRDQIAALDAATGVATGWNPNSNGDVNALVVDGSIIYVGGDFTAVGGFVRSRIAALDAATGVATSWNPNSNGTVNALAVSNGTLYVGGTFTTISGQPRNRIASLEIQVGAVFAWNPNSNGTVNTLAVDGATVYAGGLFTSMGGQPRNYIAAVDTGTAIATAWNPDANGEVRALAVSGGTVYAGGLFTSVGGQQRNRIAALDAATGAAIAWNPDANGQVRALAGSGGTIYAGGDFTSIGGQARNFIAALDATTGAATAWNPNASPSYVAALAVSGGIVYAGGKFAAIGGQTRNRIAALDVATGAATPWDPGDDPAGDVLALAVSGSTVYAGGIFTDMGGQARNRIAAIDAATGAATGWDPNASGTVRALAVSGGTVYAGGSFTTIGGQARNRIAALDATTGLATAWNPNASSTVHALAVSGGTVYAGGEFPTMGGQARDQIAALDAVTGAARAWNPGAGARVFALAAGGTAVLAGGEFTSIGGRARSGFAGIAVVPEVVAVQPARGGNTGVVTLTVSGVGLRAGATVRLSRGQPDLLGSGVTVAPDGLSLTATFDLTGADLGPWDVGVTNPDLQTAALPSGFTVERVAPRQIRVDVVGRPLMRPNRQRAFDLVLENLGNLDELAVPLWISGIPLDATVDLDFELAPPPQDGILGEPDWSAVPDTLTGPGGRYLAVVIPRLPPGVTVLRIYLTVPNTVAGFTLDAALAPPWADGVVFRDCLAGGVTTDPACMGSQLTAINAYLATTPGIVALNGIGLWAKIAWKCEGPMSLPAALTRAEQVLDFMLQPIELAGVPSGCEVSLVPRWQDTLAVTVVTSIDPNEKRGADGRGPMREVAVGQFLPYSIWFENADTASAPAQSVVVTDVLDVTKFDLTTLSLGPIKFGRKADGSPWTVDPGSGRTYYEADVPLSPELIVRVVANLDAATGVLGWSLTSLDPETMELPDDPMLGFLPPNVVSGEGEGSLLFTVRPKPGLAGGTQIANEATIDFDGDLTLTPEWTNTLDITPPESAVLPLPENQDSVSFTVRWQAEGSPPASDLKNFSVYVSEDGITFRDWRVQTTATADTFSGPGGRTYYFYSLAEDSSGNLEPIPGGPYERTYSRVGVDEAPSLALALEGAHPNPATSGAQVWFTLPSREHAVLEVMDVAGRRLLRREVGAMGPGRHSVDVSSAARRPGLYFLRLAQGERVLKTRMVVIR